MFARYAALGWGAAKDGTARPGNMPLGIAWGSGYQNRFRKMNTTQQNATIAKMLDNGITWARIDCEWWTVQPTNGAYDWSTVDSVVSTLRAANINIVLLLNMAPAWAFVSANSAPLYAPFATPNPSLYAAFCAAAVTHFGPLGVHVFELWNEPNLTTTSSPSGWGNKLVAGYGSLALAAYPAMKAADNSCYVLGGTLATASEFGTAGNARSCSWSTVVSGATTATILCSSASSSEQYGFLYDASGSWPTGTTITAVSAGVSYTVAPPPWSSGTFSDITASSGTLQVQNSALAPDFFLTQLYAYAAGQPWCDALAIHPYTQPVLPNAHLAQYGGWPAVPKMRTTMVANGDGAKPMWITEFGAPSGAATGSWSSTSASGTALVITASLAVSNDTNYQLQATGIPSGAWVSSVSDGVSWTIMPTTKLTLSTALTAGSATTSLVLAATASGAVSIPSGTSLIIAPPVTSGNNIANTQTVTTTASATTSTSSTTSVTVSSFTPTDSFSVGSVLLGSLGQTWGSAISAASSQAVTLAPQGVPFVYGAVTESVQSQIIAMGLSAIVRGATGVSGVGGVPSWPYAYGPPVFIYCWADSNAGSFGLERVDGTSKAAMATIKKVANYGP